MDTDAHLDQLLAALKRDIQTDKALLQQLSKPERGSVPADNKQVTASELYV